MHGVIVTLILTRNEIMLYETGAEMSNLADKLNFDREVIRVWFCNKRQTLKNSIKKIKGSSSPVT